MLDLTATQAIDIAKAVTVRSDSTGSRSGNMTLEAGTITADATSTLVAGPATGAPTSRVSVYADGGNLAVGAVQGTTVLLDARGPAGGSGPSGGSGGSLTVAGRVLGTAGVTATSQFAGVTVSSNLTSAGPISVTAATTIGVGPGVTIQSDDGSAGAPSGPLGVTLTATSGAITADTSSLILAGPSADAPGAGVSISAGGDLTLGAVAGTDVAMTTPGNATLNGYVLGSHSVTIDPANIFINANVTSGGVLDLTATQAIALGSGAQLKAAGHIDAAANTISLGANSGVRSDSSGSGAGGVDLQAQTNFTADKTSLVAAGLVSAPSDTISIAAGLGGGGGNLTAGQASGTHVSFITSGAAKGGGGGLTIGGAVNATQGFVAYSDPGDPGTRPGFTEVAANVTSGGTIDMRSEGDGTLTIDAGVSVVSGGGEVYLASNHDLIVSQNAQVSGGSFAGVAQGTLHVAPGASIAATGSTSAPLWPLAPVTIVASTQEGVRTPTVTSLNLDAGGLDIQGNITSGTSSAPGDIFIRALGAPSQVTVGGADGATGFQLSDAGFSHLTGRDVIVMAGDGEGGAHNADIQLADLTIDSVKTSALWLGTSSGHAIDVVGQTVVTGGGAVDVRLGFATSAAMGQSGPSGPLGGYIPGQIAITGALGAPSAPLHTVSLLAKNDIFMGTAPFIAAAAGSPTFDAVKSSKSFPGLPQGYVFIAAADLQMSAEGRIVQQNTSTITAPDSSAYGGLDIGAPTASDPLIAAPAALDGATIGPSGWAAAYKAGPTLIDVFGVIHQSGGKTTSGVDVAQQPDLLDTAVTTSRSYRINSCVFGDHCVTIPPPTFQPPPPPPPLGQLFDSGSTVLSFESDIVLPDTDDDNHKKNAVPITESGNGDLWAQPGSSHK